MKKVFTLLTAFVLFASAGIAQVKFGPTAGVDYCIMSTTYQNTANEPDNNDPISGIGFHVGGAINLHFTDYIGLQPEVVFSQRSASDEFTLEYQDAGGNDVVAKTTSTLSHNHLKIPLMLMFSPNPKVSIYAGPQAAFLLGGKSSGESTLTVNNETTTTSLDVSGDEAVEGVSGFEFGACFGAQVNLDMGVSVGVRAERGFTPVNEDFQNVSETRWFVPQLTVAYMLGGE